MSFYPNPQTKAKPLFILPLHHTIPHHALLSKDTPHQRSLDLDTIMPHTPQRPTLRRYLSFYPSLCIVPLRLNPLALSVSLL